MTALFAVTTDLPNFNDCKIISFAKLTPNEVIKIDKKFIEDTGLRSSLTPSRSNGFLNILLKMQSQANEFL